MDINLIANTKQSFLKYFGNEPEVVILSPGRINIIGEHIDYNDGFVMPAAIDKIICFAFEKSKSITSRIIALDLNEEFSIDFSKKPNLDDKVWTNYIRGVVNQLQLNGFDFEGVNCVFSSNIPSGSGLSSSAALECGFLKGVKELYELSIKPIDIALMSQKAEHWVGINCGIMDQFASVLGVENKVIKIDCKTLEYDYHNADFGDYSLILLDSNVKHSLFTSEYNQRREECEIGLTIIKRKFPEVKNFRDCTEDHILDTKGEMEEDVFKRCYYVVKEISRVIKASIALDNNDIEGLGKLLFETHDGLTREYEVSCEELDYLVDFAKTESSIIGSRMMGGGFGGCTINLVKKGQEEVMKEKIQQLYHDKFNIELKSYDVKIGNGTTIYN
ncbi:galactokinase [Flavobacterium sp.]|uniref:galactokinase n=1 Tax=Flavobacterium sp. TaxID=239 RepID=UPI0038FC21A3